MTRLETQVLNFFAGVQILIGIWMISNPYNNENVIRVFEIYSPMWLLGVIFILGGIYCLWRKKHFWLYVLLVSIPLTFFGLVYLQVALAYTVFTSNVIIFNALGFYSAIFAGQVFSKDKLLAKI